MGLIETIRIAVIDDEALARQRIVGFLSTTENYYEVLEATNGKEGVKLLIEEEPDIVFLDIKMTDMNGFEMLQQLPENRIPIVVFVTAFDAFAVKAFEVQAIDFLLKPYKKQRFFEALERALEKLDFAKKKDFQTHLLQAMKLFQENREPGEIAKCNYLEKLVVKKNKKYYFVATNTIKYIRSSGYYAEIFTIHNEKHIYRISMSQLYELLDPNNFIRINRSTIIAQKNIDEVISEGYGDYSIKMKDKAAFPLSKSYKEPFLKTMGIR